MERWVVACRQLVYIYVDSIPYYQTGLHLYLEIDPRGGGKMSIYEKEGCLHVHKHMWFGGMLPQKILDFRLSETASSAFQGLCIE